MPKRKCTGANCPRQVGCVVPETCPEPEKCRYATFPQTNADRIRNMTDAELAEKISRMAHCVFCPIRCGILYGSGFSMGDFANGVWNYPIGLQHKGGTEWRLIT